MRLIDSVPVRARRPFRYRSLPRRPARPPTFLVYSSDPTEPVGGWRQIAQDEAILRAVIELLDEGEIEVESERERLAIVEHFRRRAHVEASTPLLGRAIGVSKQRADQLARTAIRNLQRYAGRELKGSTAKVSAKIEAASALRDFA